MNSSMQKKFHPQTFSNAYWTFMENKKWIWSQLASKLHISVVATMICASNYILYSLAQLSTNKMKCFHQHKSVDYNQETVYTGKCQLQQTSNDVGNMRISVFARWAPWIFIQRTGKKKKISKYKSIRSYILKILTDILTKEKAQISRLSPGKLTV